MMYAIPLPTKMRFHSFSVSRPVVFCSPIRSYFSLQRRHFLHFVGASDLISRLGLFFIIGRLHLSIHLRSR